MPFLTTDLAQAGPPMLAAFLASLVEFVEALTIVLAVGTVNGWRPALSGAAAAGALLVILVIVLGPALQLVPLDRLQLVIGVLLLLFGARWLRKAILRGAGLLALHDETAAYAVAAERARAEQALAWATAFKAVALEGLEVIFIVIAVGAAGNLLVPAGIGAGLALMVVIVLGFALHRPLAAVPENALKFIVGVMLSSFGLFWVGEGLGLGWPGGDWAILVLAAGWATLAGILVQLLRPLPAGERA
ncbi:MAG TPA: hypothetical protein VM689_21465 [Aliidongia sp.]|nr:hypothetical protein [Aliidongia sp.]